VVNINVLEGVWDPPPYREMEMICNVQRVRTQRAFEFVCMLLLQIADC
jgi:hypothetical protein